MTEDELAEAFQAHRRELLGVAYRLLGSMSEAEDAVQEAWLRLARTPADEIDNLGAWLRTVVARIGLDVLRQRRSRREEALEDRLPDPVVRAPGSDPEAEMLLGEAVGLALQRILDELAPSERLAFVLHDVFAIPFRDIAPIVDRTPEAARQLASRGRRRVQELPAALERDPVRQRATVDAFLAAARGGDLDGVIRLLDPDVVLRYDQGRGLRVVTGRADVVAQAASGGFGRVAASARPALVNGAPGLVFVPRGRPFAIVAFTVVEGRIWEVDVLADPARVPALVPEIPLA